MLTMLAFISAMVNATCSRRASNNTKDMAPDLCVCRDQHLQHLFSVKKLLLVLDLDHTLLSSTRMADLPEETVSKAEQLLSKQGTEDEQLLFKLPHMWMWTKLRPGIREFLTEAHNLFELHIYTHGDQDYAAEMAKLLDPKRTLFGERVISGVRSMILHTTSFSLLSSNVLAILQQNWVYLIVAYACCGSLQASLQCMSKASKQNTAVACMLYR